MIQHPSILEMWQRFLIGNPQLPEGTLFEAWAFGSDAEMAEDLLALVLKGIKTGTSSAHDLYLYDDDELPAENGYSIILDSSGQAKCIIETISVDVLPFNEVTPEQAYREGEGDRTLAYWRKVHQEFWERELRGYPLAFSEDMLVVYEEFNVVYY